MIVANLSGGRDSTAMVIRWLELGNDLDYILFCDTGLEFKQALQQGELFPQEQAYTDQDTCFCSR